MAMMPIMVSFCCLALWVAGRYQEGQQGVSWEEQEEEARGII